MCGQRKTTVIYNYL